MPHPERIVPHETSRGILALHEKRYRLALPLCRGKRVLDAGCGMGYGSAILASDAASVVGIDLDEPSIAYAQERYTAANLEFRVADLLSADLDLQRFDVVCCFEVLEHLEDGESFIRAVARALHDDGVLVLSTPRAERTTRSPDNPFHHIEYDRADFEELLRRHFGDVELYGQRRVQTRRHRAMQRLDVLGLRKHVAPLRSIGRFLTGTTPMMDLTSDEITLDQQSVDSADELVAVCRAPIR